MNGRQQSVMKTFKKYLLPIAAKVTETSTIVHYLQYFQKLAEEVNLTYVNIEDVDAAATALTLVWNCPEFGNIIHPGHFHVLKKNFQVNMDSCLQFYLLSL